MMAYSFNIFIIFIIFTVYLSLIFHPIHGFEVIQPQNQTVNQDGSASISCEHTSKSTLIKDVRLSSISQSGTSKPSLLCQKGKKNCENVIMHQVNSKKYLFIMLNIDAEAMNMAYECEFTVIDGMLDDTKQGKPTRLLPGQKETKEDCTPCSSSPPPPPTPTPIELHMLSWIAIGLLALMSLYSCVITYVYIKLRVTNNGGDPDSGTYVEMRKAPLPMNPHFDIYCG